jgi:hypothetical protein
MDLALALAIVVIIVCLAGLGYKYYVGGASSGASTEHQHPGFGRAGVYNQQFRTYESMCGMRPAEHFYSSGSSLRYLTEPDTHTEQTIDEKDFGTRELQYYLNR